MNKVLLSSVAFMLAASFAAASETAVVKDKKSCTRAVTDAREALIDASLIGKSRAEAEQLVQISAHLCTQANFVFADRLLAIARGMAAEE